jgi:hypothetical protein
MPLVQNDPEALNIVDMKKLVKMALESGNIPSVILKSDEQMDKEAEARAQQQQAQGMQEAALNMSEVIKNTGINNNA